MGRGEGGRWGGEKAGGGGGGREGGRGGGEEGGRHGVRWQARNSDGEPQRNEITGLTIRTYYVASADAGNIKQNHAWKNTVSSTGGGVLKTLLREDEPHVVTPGLSAPPPYRALHCAAPFSRTHV